jgi:hypothetical protein
VVRRRLVRRQPEEVAQAQRIRQAPRDPAVAVDALEVAHEQRPKVVPRRQARPAHHRMVEARAHLLGVPIEAVLPQHAVERPIERMAGRPHLRVRHEQLVLLLALLSHRHGSTLHEPRSLVDLDQVFRSLRSDFRHGLLGRHRRRARTARTAGNRGPVSENTSRISSISRPAARQAARCASGRCG